MVRKLTRDEIGVVETLLAQGVAGAEQFRTQFSNCLVHPINSDETILRFHVSPQAVPADVPYAQNIAVEANARDLDGCLIEVLLHVKNGTIYELEYVKANGTTLKKRPQDRDLSNFIVHW